MTDIDQHSPEMERNRHSWQQKPVLRQVYKQHHETIAAHLADHTQKPVVELGSGVADIRETIPGCIRTDLSDRPGIDRVESAYDLSFEASSLSNLILVDVFHHLRYPGTALNEFFRVLTVGGRVIIFEPGMGLLGRIVFGLLHHEPLALRSEIQWEAPPDWNPADIDYYAAQGNATRIFVRREVDVRDMGWVPIAIERFASISHVASGGYSKPQLYPDRALPAMRALDRVLSRFPGLFATRLLVVLEKSGAPRR